MMQAEKQAIKILAESKVKSPPVPVDTIAKKMGVDLVFKPFEGEGDISGILYRDDEHTVIGINAAHSNTRQRFSIAHEIGHLVLHKKKLFVDIDFRDSKASMAIDRREIAANAFAAELLMPRDFVIREIRGLLSKQSSLPKEKLINQLAKAFYVSPQAMEYRLNNLGLLIAQ